MARRRKVYTVKQYNTIYVIGIITGVLLTYLVDLLRACK